MANDRALQKRKMVTVEKFVIYIVSWLFSMNRGGNQWNIRSEVLRWLMSKPYNVLLTLTGTPLWHSSRIIVTDQVKRMGVTANPKTTYELVIFIKNNGFIMKMFHLIPLLLKYREAFTQITFWYKKNPLKATWWGLLDYKKTY